MNHPSIERLHPHVTAKGARVDLFDFDGTISLIRSGWEQVMIPMMLEIVASHFRNFRPRFGFAWDPTGRGTTAIRAGIFYTTTTR
jgi:hypothetical protein